MTQWNKCNFAGDARTGLITYCDGDHDKCHPCNEKTLLVEDVKEMADSIARLDAVKQRLAEIDFYSSRSGPQQTTVELIASLKALCNQ